jgi:hypothetical protein
MSRPVLPDAGDRQPVGVSHVVPPMRIVGRRSRTGRGIRRDRAVRGQSWGLNLFGCRSNGLDVVANVTWPRGTAHPRPVPQRGFLSVSGRPSNIPALRRHPSTSRIVSDEAPGAVIATALLHPCEGTSGDSLSS